MRSYGKNALGQWVQITDPNYIYLATLIQTLRLSQNESPIYGNYGIPGEQSVMTQIAPDAAINRTQSQYSQYFANLTIVRNQAAANPTYNVTATFLNGTVIQQIAS
jgi:hypothetical protein